MRDCTYSKIKSGRYIVRHKPIPTKILSILLAILMVTTIFSSMTASARFSDKTLKERIENFKEKTGELIEDLSSKNLKKSDDKTSNPTLLQTMSSISRLSGASTTLTLYTNYNGTEKTNELKLFRTVKVDVDGDGDDDVGAKLSLYPSIERPFSLSINFGLTITRLNGFNDVNADFKAYAEFNRPGTLDENSTGDKIRWGYHSPNDELVPNTCIATYKLIPHIFDLNKKPEHKVHISPSDDVIDKADLDIILSYVDPGVQSDEFRVSYSPASESQICLGRQGGTSFSITKELTGNSKVDLTLTHIKDSNTTYAYVYDLPGKVSFVIDLGREGKIEFNTHGEKPSEIGLCDNIDNPVNRIYFTNLATVGGLEWERDLLVDKYATIHGYTDGEDVSLNAHFQDKNETVFVDVSVVSHDEIDFSVEIDLFEMSIDVFQNGFDISFSTVIQINNNTISGSFDVSKITDGSFKILFNELSLNTVNVTVYSERTLTISNFDLFIDLPGLDLGIFAEEVSFGQDSEFNCVLQPRMEGDEIILNVSLDLGNDHSIIIKGFQACINGWCCEKRDITDSITFEFSADIIEIHVASDFSWGYILLRSIYLSTEHSFTVNGEVGGLIGTIDIKSTGGALNISWDTVDGNLTFAIDGSAVVKLENFHLWLSDRFDISIPLISCAFTFNSEAQSGELELILDESSVDIDVNFVNLDFSQIGDISLSFTLDLDLQASGSGYLCLSWEEGNFTELTADLNNVQGSGYIDIIDFVFISNLVEVSCSRLYISGDLNFEVHVLDKNFTLNAGGTGTLTDIIITELYLNVGLNTIIPLAVSTDINLDGEATIMFELNDGNITAEIEIVGNSDITINQLWVEVPFLYLVAYVQDLVINGQTSITVEVDTKNNIPIKLFVNTEEDISIYAIGLGYISDQIFYFYDIHGGAGGGYFGVGFSTESGQPVFYVNGDWYFGYVNGIEVDFSISGSLMFEGFLDLIVLEYIYFKGEVYEDTTITTSLAPDLEIILTLGYFQIMMNQGDGHVYLNFHTTSWVIIRGPEGKDIRLSGYGDIYIYLDLTWGDDGKIAFTLDINKLSGVVEIIDTIRIAGDAECYLDFSCNLNISGDTISISNVDLNLTGDVDAVIQIKPEDSSWIPIIPFTTDPYILLLTGTSMKDDKTARTITDSANVAFEAWYCPPLSLEEDLTGTYTYTFSFSDSSETYQVTTDKTYVFCPAHVFPLGGPHTVTVSVDASNPEIPTVEDEMYITVIQEGYCTQSPGGRTRLYLNYDDVGPDGKIHTWINVKNLAVEEFPYTLHWTIEAGGTQASDPDVQQIWNIDQWTIDPSGGVLNVGEDVDVDVGIVPPSDHEDHYHLDEDVVYIAAYDINNEDDGTYVSAYIFDGCILLEPYLDKIKIPAVEPGGSITSSFWIRNMGRKSCNWSIASHPPLGTWTFNSPNSGMIPNGGSAPVQFTVTAPNQEGLDLSGEIKVINLDDPSDYHTVQVNLKTKGSSGPPPDVEIREENGKIILKISGYININVDNFQFTVNDVSGLLNGFFHFESTTDYVEITIDPDGSQVLTCDGSGEFAVDNFKIVFGDIVNVSIGYIVGSFEFTAGKSGKFNITINDTFTDVNVYIDIDHSGDNFHISGIFNVDITGETNGSLCIEWDLNGENPVITFDGYLEREGSFTFSITGLVFEVEGVSVTADILSITGSGGNIVIKNDEFSYDANIDEVIIDDLYVNLDLNEFPGDIESLHLTGTLDLSLIAELSIKIHSSGSFTFEASGGFSLDIYNTFLLDVNEGWLVLSWTSLYIEGLSLYVSFGEIVEIHADITEFDIVEGYLYIPSDLTQSLLGLSMHISGYFDISGTANIDIYTNPELDFTELEIYAYGSLTIDITNFNININNGQFIVSGTRLYINSLSIGASIVLGGDITLSASLSSAILTDCYVYASGEGWSLSGSFNLVASGLVYVKTDLANYAEITVSGGASLTITDFELSIGNTFLMEAESFVFTLDAGVTATLKIQDEKLFISGSGGFSLSLATAYIYYYNNNGNHIYLTANIPSFSVSLGASVDYVEFDIGGKPDPDPDPDPDPTVKELTLRADLILDGDLNIQADFTLQDQFRIDADVNGYASLEIPDLYLQYKEDGVEKLRISLDYAKISGDLGPNGHILLGEYLEVSGSGSGTRIIDVDYLTFSFTNFSGSIDNIYFVGNTGPTIYFYLGEDHVELTGSGSGTHTLNIDDIYVSGPDNTIDIYHIDVDFNDDFYFGEYIEITADGSITITDATLKDSSNAIVFSLGSLSLSGDGYFYLGDDIDINSAISITVEDLVVPDTISVDYFDLTFSGSFSGQLHAEEGYLKIDGGGSSVNIPSLTVTNLCGPQGKCLSFGGAITLSSSNGVLEIRKQADGSTKIDYSGSATLTLNGVYINSINIDQITLGTASGSGSVTCALIFHDDGSIELTGTGTDLHLENLRWSGKIKRVDIDLEGSITFMIGKDTKITSLSATVSCDINVEMEGWLVDKIKCSSIDLDGSIIIDSSNPDFKPIITIDCNSLSVISMIEIYKTLVEKIKLTTLTVSNSLVTINASDNSFSFDGDIYIVSMIYRDNIGIDRITVTNIDIDGDIYVKKLGDKHFYIESQSGFDFYASTSTMKIFEFEFIVDFHIQGDLEIHHWMPAGYPRIRFNSINNADITLSLTVDNFNIEIDFDIDSGYIVFEWNLDGDCDGYFAIDSSNVIGTISATLMYSGYGIRSTISEYIDADGYLLQWDPCGGVILPLYPCSPHETGSIDFGTLDIDFYDQNNWYDIYPELFDEDSVADAGGPYTGTEDQPILFDASGSTDPNDDVLQYKWDWTNDGTYDTDWLDSPTEYHTYDQDGYYTVKLQVREKNTILHRTDTDTASVTVQQGTTIPPVAKIGNNVEDNSPYEIGESFWCDAFGSYDPDGPYSSLLFYWDFGDGTNADGDFVQHSYSAPGPYTITLTVTDDDGLTGTDTASIVVNDNQNPEVSLDVYMKNIFGQWVYKGNSNDPGVKVRVGRPIKFVPDAYDPDGYIAQYRWYVAGNGGWGDWEDGEPSTVIYSWGSTGYYGIRLDVKDDTGAQNHADVNLHVALI